MDFNVAVTSQGRWEVLSVTGEIDMATAPRFREQILAVINTSVPTVAPQVVLDLTSVDFIDSTGLGVLMGAAKRVRSAGGDIRLVQGNSRVADLLEVTCLNLVMDVFNSVAEATQGATPHLTASKDNDL